MRRRNINPSLKARVKIIVPAVMAGPVAVGTPYNQGEVLSDLKPCFALCGEEEPKPEKGYPRQRKRLKTPRVRGAKDRENRRRLPSDFTCRNKCRGRKASPTRFTSDGNADRSRVFAPFHIGVVKCKFLILWGRWFEHVPQHKEKDRRCDASKGGFAYILGTNLPATQTLTDC